LGWWWLGVRGRRRMQNPRRGAVGFVGLVGAGGCVCVDVRARRTASGRVHRVWVVAVLGSYVYGWTVTHAEPVCGAVG
jgi:hypothetical protein